MGVKVQAIRTYTVRRAWLAETTFTVFPRTDPDNLHVWLDVWARTRDGDRIAILDGAILPC